MLFIFCAAPFESCNVIAIPVLAPLVSENHERFVGADVVPASQSSSTGFSVGRNCRRISRVCLRIVTPAICYFLYGVGASVSLAQRNAAVSKLAVTKLAWPKLTSSDYVEWGVR